MRRTWRSLLSPLGIYDLEEHSASRRGRLRTGNRAGHSQPPAGGDRAGGADCHGGGRGAGPAGGLFARRPAAVTAEDRRAAIAALLQIDGDSLTPAAIDRTIRGCGIRARALEMGGGQLRVIFPEVAGEPEDFDQIRKIILDILPCHLEVEFYFRYLTWAECEAAGYTWGQVEAAEYTWESFQLAVPPER